jgi:hypothetical protein
LVDSLSCSDDELAQRRLAQPLCVKDEAIARAKATLETMGESVVERLEVAEMQSGDDT